MGGSGGGGRGGGAVALVDGGGATEGGVAEVGGAGAADVALLRRVAAQVLPLPHVGPARTGGGEI